MRLGTFVRFMVPTHAGRNESKRGKVKGQWDLMRSSSRMRMERLAIQSSMPEGANQGAARKTLPWGWDRRARRETWPKSMGCGFWLGVGLWGIPLVWNLLALYQCLPGAQEDVHQDMPSCGCCTPFTCPPHTLDHLAAPFTSTGKSARRRL